MGSLSPLEPLFQPLRLGAFALQHRVIQAPCTRMRSTKESDGVWVPNDLNVQYYEQRASNGGLMLTEATPISASAAGYPGVPGIFTPSQIAGWKKVTDAVHAKGGLILCQLWHVGRATTPGMLGGKQPVSSSDIPISGNAPDGTVFADAPPRPMTVDDIKETVAEYAAASKRAIEAGFDGVEIHGANGYLLDQFLHDNVNTRTDAYGGSIENRARFVLEVISAVTDAIGADRVGIRLSPYNYFQDTRDSNPPKHWSYLCDAIASLPDSSRLAYVHMVEPRFDEVLDESEKINQLETTQEVEKPSLDGFRTILKKGGVSFIAAGNFKGENAGEKVGSDGADAIAFGRLFISNPDLPKRLKEGLPLTKYDRETFYGANPPEKGYTDYAFA
ncbi:alkene reductase [Aspergillus stella-maris]|uniref:alkene reductase n=1 Tax=Aspergillus stella-maris TaxID=1810926 RepID=UPI003CCDC13B